MHEGIQSVLGQLPEDYELVIVDDGSTDGTVEKLKAYEGTRENIKIFYADHKGASAARNKGLDLAIGRFVAFMDCDDCLQDGFIEKSRPLFDKDADLYIFGIEWIPLLGEREYWTVTDRYFETASDFADEYIRARKMLVYSNCNKFYRRSIIEDYQIRFREGLAFGEDRLLNYEYLAHCGSIVTSSLIYLRYIQRSLKSMSSGHVPNYFETVLMLHDKKIDCFLNLSKGTSKEERADFAAYDISTEIERTINRFSEHPEEKEENLPKIKQYIMSELANKK